MTLTEAIDRKVKRVTTKPWNKYAHVLLPDFQGPWAMLVDPCSNLAMFNPANHQTAILMVNIPNAVCFDPNRDGWEEWIPPEDYIERFENLPEYMVYE
jgi:hypothetical protein